jgi:hypothetical protein
VPGTYRTAGSSGCYWARLGSLDTSDIIENNNSNGPQVVGIQPTNKAFLTQRSARTWIWYWRSPLVARGWAAIGPAALLRPQKHALNCGFTVRYTGIEVGSAPDPATSADLRKPAVTWPDTAQYRDGLVWSRVVATPD